MSPKNRLEILHGVFDTLCWLAVLAAVVCLLEGFTLMSQADLLKPGTRQEGIAHVRALGVLVAGPILALVFAYLMRRKVRVIERAQAMWEAKHCIKVVHIRHAYRDPSVVRERTRR